MPLLFTCQTTENEFTITIKKSTEFYIAVDFISHGLSFRQVENTFDSLRKRRKLSSTMYRENVSNIARIVCAVNLQRLSSLLNNPTMWAFSLANDGSTHWGHSYLDNRIRLYFNGKLYNIHLLAIPMFWRDSAQTLQPEHPGKRRTRAKISFPTAPKPLLMRRLRVPPERVVHAEGLGFVQFTERT